MMIELNFLGELQYAFNIIIYWFIIIIIDMLAFIGVCAVGSAHATDI